MERAVFRISRLAMAACACVSIGPNAMADDGSNRMIFEGRVEPSRTVVVANHVDGVVEDLHFMGGESVAAGDLLAEIDTRGFAIALTAAHAALAEAEATLRLAQDDAERQSELLSRGTGPRVAALRAAVARDIAAAQRDARQADVDAAILALERARVNAPIGGTISPPRVAEGSFVEAEAGTALAEIVVLDPVRVAYHVPYAERSRALASAGVATPAELFERIDLTLTLPSGEVHPHAGRPVFESAAIDPGTETLTVWGLFPNPARTLVPGLGVNVTATIRTSKEP